MNPPTRHRATASTRNCRRMSLASAPTAIRRPISRVRSVTDTSMMFMIPTPPTSSETAAIGHSQAGQHGDDFFQGVGDLGHVVDVEIRSRRPTGDAARGADA